MSPCAKQQAYGRCFTVDIFWERNAIWRRMGSTTNIGSAVSTRNAFLQYNVGRQISMILDFIYIFPSPPASRHHELTEMHFKNVPAITRVKTSARAVCNSPKHNDRGEFVNGTELHCSHFYRCRPLPQTCTFARAGWSYDVRSDVVWRKRISAELALNCRGQSNKCDRCRTGSWIVLLSRLRQICTRDMRTCTSMFETPAQRERRRKSVQL